MDEHLAHRAGEDREQTLDTRNVLGFPRGRVDSRELFRGEDAGPRRLRFLAKILRLCKNEVVLAEPDHVPLRELSGFVEWGVVQQGAVLATQVLKDVTAVLRSNLGVVAGEPLVGKTHLVLPRSPDSACHRPEREAPDASADRLETDLRHWRRSYIGGCQEAGVGGGR